jgi:hypothetical protein
VVLGKAVVDVLEWDIVEWDIVECELVECEVLWLVVDVVFVVCEIRGVGGTYFRVEVVVFGGGGGGGDDEGGTGFGFSPLVP